MSRAMKDSGIPWIGEIPSPWRLYQTSTIFHEHKEKNVGVKENNLLSLSYGKIKRKDINTNEGLLPQSFETYNIVQKGDIVFRLTDLQNDKRSLRTGLCAETGIITSAYVTLRANTTIDTRYFHYLYHSYDICKVFYGLGDGVRQGMNYDDLRKLLVLFPSYSEQQAIADFLDNKCGEIDELIALQEKIIEELKAYKQSVITEAVTKGLNPDVPMKDSGIEWIGQIPEHWNVCRIKNVITLLTDYDANGSFADIAENVKVNIGEPFAWMVRATDLENKRYGIQEGNNYCDEPTYKYLSKSYLLGGELIIAKRGEIGKVYLVPLCECKMTLAPNTYVLRLKEDLICNRYLYYFLLSDRGKAQLVLNNKSTAIGALYKDDVKQLTISLPHLMEQQTIADYLDKKCSDIDALISIKQSKIEELKEYKKSIIYECATGKKDVPYE